jgi:hypothetical protein
MLDQTGTSAIRMVASAFPELRDHSSVISLVNAMGFQFGEQSGFLPSARARNIEALVTSMFPASDAAQALSLVQSITDDDTNAEAARTRLAALRISAGSISELKKAVRSARTDFREVLVQAESMHKFVGSVRPLAPGVPDRPTEVFREYVLWLLRHLQPDTFVQCGEVGK